MPNLILLGTVSTLWWLFPLAMVVSLVYNTSRYEAPKVIFRRSVRIFMTIVIFMALALGFLQIVSP